MPDDCNETKPVYARAYRNSGYYSDPVQRELQVALSVISAQLASGFQEILDRLDRDYQLRLRQVQQVPVVRPQQLVPEDWDADGDGWAEDVGPDSPTLEDER